MNTQFWKLYKESERGRKTIEMFNPERDVDVVVADDMFGLWSPSDKDTWSALYYELLVNIEANEMSLSGENRKECYEQFIDGLEWRNFSVSSEDNVDMGNRITLKKDDYRRKASLVNIISVYLYLHYNFYKPILAKQDFPKFRMMCDSIGIELPPVPKTTNYRDYLLYYFDICEAFERFQEENDLTDEEFCACLYDFSLMSMEAQASTAATLPEPTNVWLVGADKEDIKRIENSEAHTYVWQCNERTRRGDIIVMYAKSPYSCIHSVWRAVSEGSYNPFDYYRCRVMIGERTDIPKVGIQELKRHPYLSQLPIVRKNLQGVNGVEVSARDYEELLRLIAEKGGAMKSIPRLFSAEGYEAAVCLLEKDVEEKILIPLLSKLGYEEQDYTRQLRLKAGRGMREIPDFVFFPHGLKHFENAPFIIEAKKEMRTIADRNDAFSQALSYARMLNSVLMGICDEERLIIYRVQSGTADADSPVFENHWAKINTEADTYLQLKKLIGKDTVRML